MNYDDILASRYEVQQQLAKKAGRRTLLARDRLTGELVVVKILSFGSDFEWDDLKLFEREAKTLKALSHPAIPRYLDYFDLDLPNGKEFALVQSYIPAKSLETYLKAGHCFSEQEVEQLAKALLEILIYLHAHQPPVIHRDIKPSNILLGSKRSQEELQTSDEASSLNAFSEVYLVDFGSVQTLAAREGGTMTVVGTYGYMPPEQFGDRAVPASDLYSLGATLICLVTGTHPADLPQKDLQIQFEPAANLSPAFARWLRWMTQPSLDRRLSSAQAALQALERSQLQGAAPLVRKPANSKVLLQKDTKSLEILIPSYGFHPVIGFLIPFAIAWNAGVFALTQQTLSSPLFPIGLLLTLFSLPFWAVGISLVLLVSFLLFGKVRLCINRKQVSLTYELFGFKYYHPRPTQREKIDKLEYQRGFFTKDSEGDRVEVKPQINIWAGAKKYELAGSELLSEPELEWLAAELGDWLGIPITRK
jgi:serine/threonine protein kinase